MEDLLKCLRITRYLEWLVRPWTVLRHRQLYLLYGSPHMLHRQTCSPYGQPWNLWTTIVSQGRTQIPRTNCKFQMAWLPVFWRFDCSNPRSTMVFLWSPMHFIDNLWENLWWFFIDSLNSHCSKYKKDIFTSHVYSY